MRVEMGELLWRTGMGWKTAFLSEVESCQQCQATISHFLLEPLSSIASVFDCLEGRTLLLLGLQ